MRILGSESLGGRWGIQKRVVEEESKVFNPSNWKDRVAIS